MKPNEQTPDSWPFVGQEALGRHLLQAEDQDRLSGPLLFSGPAATGKASAARWLARRHSCTSKRVRPCDQCPSCRQALADQHPDIREIQAEPGARVGIEQIRSMLQPLKAKTWGHQQRWLLLLDADRLTEQASNVLLKFLEELPTGCRVIMTSSHPDALLATVRSRVTEYRWHLASASDMRQRARDRAVVQRAAGRPGWADAAQRERQQQEEQRLLTIAELQSFVVTAHRDRGADRSDLEQQLQTEELILRELLLAHMGAEQRLLWPGHRERIQRCAKAIGIAAIVDLAQRYLDRYELSPNIQPRLLYEDLHLV